MNETNQQSSSRTPWAMFIIAQCVIVPTLLALPFADSRAHGLQLPSFQNEPLAIEPLRNDPQVISDEQLRVVLTKLKPRLAHPQPKINFVDHALRFWGVDAQFHDSECMDGAAMRQLLLNHSQFVQAWGTSAAPLLKPAVGGVSVRTQEGMATASHVDHTLATLAEVGTPLNAVIETAAGPATVADMLRAAIVDFSLNQQEYEWTTVALTLYAPNAEPWRSKEGQQITFDRLAERIMRQRYVQGVCFGNHRLFTLAVMLRVDNDKHILSSTTRQRVMDHLFDASRRLVASQKPEGCWDKNWSNSDDGDNVNTPLSHLSQKLLATGHALEWWAIAPPELLPPRDVLVRGGQWLADQVAGMEDTTIRDNYTVLTHVGRALSLWRGATPAALYKKLFNSDSGSE